MPNKTSPHILGSAANLLGFCLIIISSLHIAQKTQNSILDELASIISMTLIVACIFSFASIKTNQERKEKTLETIADFLFIASLTGIFLIILFISIKLWNN